MDPREAERFEEDLDLEYHDASENPPIPEAPEPTHTPSFSHRGCGSSSLRECIELLNNTRRNAPATLHSGVKDEKLSDPQQVTSPNVEERQTTASATVSGSMPSDASLLKDEPQSRTDQVKSEATTPKLESPTLDVKEELSEPEAIEQNPDALREEVQENRETPPHDSEDSLSPERVADELRRLTETQAQTVSATPYQVLRKEPQLQIPLGIGKEPQLQIPLGIGKTVVPTHLRDREGTGVDSSLRTRVCFVQPFG